jgi:uncharacterized protein YbbK (DUF523 family)/uncharacterized protein YbgA (DUF1722 family)
MSEFIKPKVVISSCLEHEHVRYDGTMISDPFVRRMKNEVDFITVCPETAIGLPSPREALRLVRETHDGELKLLSSIKGKDHTDKMHSFIDNFVDNLPVDEVDGFLLKAKSPTCGVKSVKVYKGTGKAQVYGQKVPGLFGEQVISKYGHLPIETERRISNFVIRDQFFTSLFTLARFRDIKKDHKMKDLVAFHSNNKYLLMCYSQSKLKDMGNIVANHDKQPVKLVYDFYENELRDLFNGELSTNRRVNVYTHIYGYFKDRISKKEKDFYFETLNDYVNDKVPYTSVLKMLQSWAIRFDEAYLLNQSIFKPYPKSLLNVSDSGKQS